MVTFAMIVRCGSVKSTKEIVGSNPTVKALCLARNNLNMRITVR
jgi:hypothetical protein